MKKSEALKILGLADGATDDEVKAAHRKKVVENHPDRFAQDSDAFAKAEERTKLINEARDVLLNRSWKPEYGGYASPYASPYNPYAGGYPGTGGGSSGNPFEGWPFGQGQGQGGWTWTSWDVGTGGDRPFNPFDPFGASQAEQKTPEELKAEAKKDLQVDGGIVAGKVAVLAILAAFGLFPIGMFIYVVASVVWGIWKKLKGCLAPFIVPILLVVVPLLSLLAPRAPIVLVPLGIATLIAFILDVRNLRDLVRRYRSIAKP